MAQDEPRKHRCISLVLTLWATVAAQWAWGQEGFSITRGELLRFGLSTGGSDLIAEVVGDSGSVESSFAMDLGPDGKLYVVGSPSSRRLYVIDPENADTTLIGELDFTGQAVPDMTFDDQGRLWLVTWTETFPYFSNLFQVDPQTAATTEVATGMEAMRTLGSHDGVLYGITGDFQSSEYSLVSIDPATGNLTPVAAVTGLEPGPTVCVRIPTSMDFDDGGHLWIAATWLHSCILPIPDISTGMHFYDDPFDGIQTSQSIVMNMSGSPLHLRATAVRGSAYAPLDVPTVSFGGALVMATVLVAAALVLVSRRPWHLRGTG